MTATAFSLEDGCPLPGNLIPGEGIVIASGYYTDDIWAVLVLRPEAPFYKMMELSADTGGKICEWEAFDNIIPAAQAFDEAFGLWGGA